MEYLKRLAWDGARRRYPHGIPEKVRRLIEHELNLIEALCYEAYFLTVWDLVRFARERGILCQGRGSAANSAVCYCLGFTSIGVLTRLSRTRLMVPSVGSKSIDAPRKAETLLVPS